MSLCDFRCDELWQSQKTGGKQDDTFLTSLLVIGTKLYSRLKLFRRVPLVRRYFTHYVFFLGLHDNVWQKSTKPKHSWHVTHSRFTVQDDVSEKWVSRDCEGTCMTNNWCTWSSLLTTDVTTVKLLNSVHSLFTYWALNKLHCHN